MLDQEPKYESYKPVDSDWADEVPVGWQTLPIRALLFERKEQNIGPKTENILSVVKDVGVIPYDERGNTGNKKSDDIERYKLVYPGDLVLNKMNAIIGSLGVSKHFGAFSQVYIVLRPRNPDLTSIDYFGYLFSIRSFQRSLIKISKGIMEIRESIDMDEFKKIILPVPDLDTQNRIVRFLDEKTAQIDAAMDKKRRLIDLLNEQKAILINHAVTKGLNPKAPMKDSGVDWIGEIPAHWDVKKFKFLIDRLVGGSTPSMDNQRYWNGHIPWASPKDMRSAVIYDTQLKITDAGRWANGLELVPSNSMIFVARSGVLKNRIPVALTGNDLTLNQDMKAVVPKTLTSEFLISLFNGLQSILLQQVTKIGATVDSVEIPDLMNLPIAYPPRKEEQEMIVRRASELSSSVGTTIACVEREIATLNEFKQTLIANAVTGKIKI